MMIFVQYIEYYGERGKFQVISVLEELRDAAARSGKSQQQLVDETGISKGTISRILSGMADNPTIQNVIDLSAAIGYELRLVRTGAVESLEPETAELLRSGIASRDDRIALLEERMDVRDAAIRSKDDDIRAKDDELFSLHTRSRKHSRVTLILSLLVCFLAMLCVYLVADALNGGWGFFRH